MMPKIEDLMKIGEALSRISESISVVSENIEKISHRRELWLRTHIKAAIRRLKAVQSFKTYLSSSASCSPATIHSVPV
jgi:hypothetical protein